ncbi:hypothetical protein AB0D67_35900 [Streptosporangium sp. NPDC048047]|uniref:hypothetical protein n=1 Tax=Streptosporangium sp. NPDC048047 TaxID=3155748 RepID=UPI003436C859
MVADDRLTDPEEELARRLREAHRRVRGLHLPADRRERLARRLISINDAAKHNVGHAARRLDSFLLDLDALVSDTPSPGNIAEGD